MAECGRTPCSHSDSCFLTKKNRDDIFEQTCRVRELIHQLQCSSTRAKGDNAAACFSAREVSAQEMTGVVEDLEHAGRQLQEELRKHLDLHEVLGLRRTRGRAQRADTDSGVVVSWTLDTGLPVQEEERDGKVSSAELVTSALDGIKISGISTTTTDHAL